MRRKGTSIIKRRPGEVRDAILSVLSARPDGVPLRTVEQHVEDLIGKAARSSVRSYLRLNTPSRFVRTARGHYGLKALVRVQKPCKIAEARAQYGRSFSHGKAQVIEANCLDWLRVQRANTIHAIVTDPPYGLFEYSVEQQIKLRNGKGGVWRIPPSFDGTQRSPLPRFTVLSDQDLRALELFFFEWGQVLLPVLVPGANVIVATNPLLSYLVSSALARAGLERRGEIVRLVMTMRGGDRPKAAHEEFHEVSVMPRSMWEPWLVFRKPLEGRVQDNLRKWGTGGFRRPSADKPFGDVIPSAPTHKSERTLAPHPNLKPQQFLRALVRGVLPLGEGIVLDPFCGAGSTLAAAESVGYSSIGLEKDPHYFEIARKGLPLLMAYKNGANHRLIL
ncbi:MAG: site-specific DNA-methyltransferase [Nitrospirae bacterium]|nr:MAG: site-specific DNA-methyltransferase [Nitrospirota bacterium]